MYVYRADSWCDSCGEDIRNELLESEALDPNMSDCISTDPDNESSYDSDVFPKGPYPGEATDSPDHCASGKDCLEYIDLSEYGLDSSAPMFGAEDSRIGALLSSGLTEHGISYLVEMLEEKNLTPYQVALHNFWREVFADEIRENDPATWTIPGDGYADGGEPYTESELRLT